MGTVRDALAAALPHVSLKAALTALIQQSRSLKRSGHAVSLTSRAAVDRFTGQQFDGQFEATHVKQLLREVLNAETEEGRSQAALAVNDLAASSAPTVQSEPVCVQIGGGPLWLSSDEIDAWLGTDQGSIVLEPHDASAWIHHLDGLDIGGATLSAKADLPQSHELPAIRRAQRSRSRARGNQCWLPHTDEEGRFSATPRSIATAQAKLMTQLSTAVVDPFCGAGANAIAAALQGADVYASDIDHSRVELAKLNAEQFGVAERIHFSVCDAADAIRKAGQLRPKPVLFLDPPWGGVDWDRGDMRAETLFRAIGSRSVNAVVDEYGLSLVVKLPRTFDTTSLVEDRPAWRFSLELGPTEDHIADRVRLITGVRAYTPYGPTI